MTQNVQQKRRRRNQSNVGAVGSDYSTAPGAEPCSPHGSNVRSPFLTLREQDGQWSVVRVDFPGILPIPELSTLVRCESLLDASIELALWAEGLGLPWADWEPGVAGPGSPVSVSRGHHDAR